MKVSPETKCARCGSPGMPGAPCLHCLLEVGIAQPAGTAEAGDDVPGYRLLEKIGEGGMGEVFLAEQTVPVHREVALKLLRPELAAAEWTLRFAVEREALAHLQHPGIAAVYDAGTSVGGRPWYAMELVDGQPVTDFCRRMKCSVKQRLLLFASICEAVHYAHGKGVLHGDLKPSNILVMQDAAGAAQPKLIDFGILRASRAHAADGAVASPFGTSGYVSPEQSQAGGAPDARSDVYALGVVLRELLEGDPALRGEAGWIVRKAAGEAPGDRYDSAMALAADVQALLEMRPLAAGPRCWKYRLAKLLRRRRRFILTWSAALLFAGAALAFSMRQAWLAHGAAQAAAAADRAAEEERVRSIIMDDFAHGLAATLQEPDAAQRRMVTLGLMRHLAARADEAAAHGYTQAALAVRMAVGAACQGMGSADEAAAHFRAAAALTGGQPALKRAAEGALARALLRSGDLAGAGMILESLVASTPPGAGPDVCDPLLDFARLRLRERRFAEAGALAQRALNLIGTEHPARPAALHLMGTLRLEEQRYEEAHRLLSEAVECFRRAGQDSSAAARDATVGLDEAAAALRRMKKQP